MRGTPFFLVALLNFCFRIIALKMLNFRTFLPLKNFLAATFNETRAPTSRKYVAEQGMMMLNLLRTLQSF